MHRRELTGCVVEAAAEREGVERVAHRKQDVAGPHAHERPRQGVARAHAWRRIGALRPLQGLRGVVHFAARKLSDREHALRRGFAETRSNCGVEPTFDGVEVFLPERENRRVGVAVTDRMAALTATVRGLADAGIAVEDVSLRRPTLDEVFLALTGRPEVAA